MGKIPYKTYLSESELPKAWYNMRADMKEQHPPMLHPGTLQPVTVADLHGACQTGAGRKDPVCRNSRGDPGFL